MALPLWRVIKVAGATKVWWVLLHERSDLKRAIEDKDDTGTAGERLMVLALKPDDCSHPGSDACTDGSSHTSADGRTNESTASCRCAEGR